MSHLRAVICFLNYFQGRTLEESDATPEGVCTANQTAGNNLRVKDSFTPCHAFVGKFNISLQTKPIFSFFKV